MKGEKRTVRVTIFEELPPKQPQQKRSRYRAYIEAALEHEGRWVRLDAFGAGTWQEAQTMVSGLRYAAASAVKRLGLKAGFKCAVRKAEDGKYYPFVLKTVRGESFRAERETDDG